MESLDLLTPRTLEAHKRITTGASPATVETIRGPVSHAPGYWVWHFTTTEDKRGRVRCTFRDHLTLQRIPDQWELIWIHDPLTPPPHIP